MVSWSYKRRLSTFAIFPQSLLSLKTSELVSNVEQTYNRKRKFKVNLQSKSCPLDFRGWHTFSAPSSDSRPRTPRTGVWLQRVHFKVCNILDNVGVLQGLRPKILKFQREPGSLIEQQIYNFFFCKHHRHHTTYKTHAPYTCGYNRRPTVVVGTESAI